MPGFNRPRAGAACSNPIIQNWVELNDKGESDGNKGWFMDRP